MTKQQLSDRDEARAALRELLPPGSTVHTTVKYVARSGMSRSISCYVIRDNKPRWLDPLICKATDYSFDQQREAVKIGGCGMDMGFAIVYDLSYALYPKGFSVTERCTGCQDKPGKNGLGDPCKKCQGTGQQPARGRNGDMSGWDNDGGYALRQRWL